MDKERREKIAKIVERLGSLRDEINEIENEEQEYLDNLPDSIRDGEKGDRATDTIDILSSAVSIVDDAISYLEDAKGE